MRTFVVGDIHGHLRKLRGLLGQLRWEAAPGDALVFVGDYIDRGPDSRGVIDLVLEQAGSGWNGPVSTLKGNHEVLMLDFMAPRPEIDPEVWRENGAVETALSYSPQGWSSTWTEAVPPEHVEFLHSLKAWHEDEHGIYVHAGIRPGLSPEESSEDDLLWIREEFIDSDYRWPKVVVFGHTPQHERVLIRPRDPAKLPWRPLDRPEKIGIDTGAGWGGPLTAVMLPDRRFFSVR
jgi:serine/threonine protein phosphatase 1